MVAVVLAALVLPVLLRDAAAPVPQRSVLLAVRTPRRHLGGQRRDGPRAGRRSSPCPSSRTRRCRAWAFACGLLLPPPWLLAVVPSPTRTRGGAGSGCRCGSGSAPAATCSSPRWPPAWWRHALFDGSPAGVNWMNGNGGHGLVAILAAGRQRSWPSRRCSSTAVAYLNHAEDEVWLARDVAQPVLLPDRDRRARHRRSCSARCGPAVPGSCCCSSRSTCSASGPPCTSRSPPANERARARQPVQGRPDGDSRPRDRQPAHLGHGARAGRRGVAGGGRHRAGRAQLRRHRAATHTRSGTSCTTS